MKKLTVLPVDDEIMIREGFADKINGLPRKVLGYATSEQLFERELDLIYSA